jgi:diacylglycerol kinase (ATP)
MIADPEIIEEDLYSTNDLILFANPRSGSNKAKEYLKLSNTQLKLSTASSTTFIHIYDLTNNESRSSGVLKIKDLLNSPEIVLLRIVVAGGDGSLIWTIELLKAQGVNFNQIAFAILPFGSGNDLAATLGWGRDPPSDLMESYMFLWLKALPHQLDIWDLKLKVHDNGGFGKVKKTKENVEKYFLERNGEKQKKIKKLMSNYFSIGLDARIGLGFDKHRTKSKCCNRFFYFWEGIKKMCCCLKTASIPEVVKSVKEQDNVIFDNASDKLTLDEDTSVLLALNIRTYGGGNNFVWDKSRGKAKRKWLRQSPNDGNLEILSFSGKMSLGLEQIKCTQGQARKLEQGPGPFSIEFDQTKQKCYFQIDGEYFFMEAPKSARLKLWEMSKEIKVLFRAK